MLNKELLLNFINQEHLGKVIELYGPIRLHANIGKVYVVTSDITYVIEWNPKCNIPCFKVVGMFDTDL